MIDKLIIRSIKYAQGIKEAVIKSTWSKAFGRGSAYFDNNKRVTSPYSQVPSVFKAIKAITDNITQAEILIRNRSTKDDVDDYRLRELLANPNPLQDGDLFQETITGFQALYGEFFIVKTLSKLDSRTLPLELWAFNPKKFVQKVDKTTGALVGWMYNNIFFSNEEVIHCKTFNPADMYRGLSPLLPIDIIIDVDYQSMVFNKAFFDNSATPSLFLSTDKNLSKDQRERLREWIKKNFTGASKAFKTLVGEAGLKIEKMANSHKDMDFIEQKRYTREEIYGIWRVPKSMFSITDDLNYSTAIEQQRMFWESTINPIMRKTARALNKGLVWPYNDSIEIYYDTSNVPAFKEALEKKLQSAAIMRDLGYPTNAINKKLDLGMDDIEWGNTWYKPFNLTDVNEAPYEPEPTKEAPAKMIKAPFPLELPEVEKPNESPIWKRFLARHTRVEIPFAKAIKTHFFNQRKTILSNMAKSFGGDLKSIDKANKYIKKDADIGINWAEQNKLLITRTAPFQMIGIQEGFEFAESFGLLIEQEIVSTAAMASTLAEQSKKITRINDTVRRQIESIISSGIDTGQTILEMSAEIRTVYTNADKRAPMIARTQTTGSLNAGTQTYYKETGVRQKQWLTAGDESVRETHINLNGQVVDIDKPFGNGLMFPGGSGEASEVINCRCTQVPILESDPEFNQ